MSIYAGVEHIGIASAARGHRRWGKKKGRNQVVKSSRITVTELKNLSGFGEDRTKPRFVSANQKRRGGKLRIMQRLLHCRRGFFPLSWVPTCIPLSPLVRTALC